MRQILLMIAITMPIILNAQTDEDALRYSTLSNSFGTARSMGAGGAFGALGGDFSSLSSNPAGIGVYRSSELIITPGFHIGNTNTRFFDERNEDNRYNFHFNNLGVVFTKTYQDSKGNPRKNGWINANMGIGYNRLANFNNTTYLSGFNAENSLLDRYVQDANANGGTYPSDMFNEHHFGAGLAYYAFLLNPLPSDTLQFNSVIPNGGVQQTKNIDEKGAYDEITVSFGGNYDNRVFVGATIGIPNIKYESHTDYREEDIHDTIAGFASFEQYDYLRTEGAGINVKLGMIWKVNDFLRLGGGIHSPTRLSLNDRYYTSVESDLETEQHTDIQSDDATFDYKIITPWRLMANAAFIINKNGFISVDYEWLDNGLAKFQMDRDRGYARQLNQTIGNKYGGVSIVRMGGEWAINDFRLRAGGNYQTSPFNNSGAQGDADYSQWGWSVGAGLRQQAFFIDVAFMKNNTTEFHVPYTLQDANETVGGAIVEKNKTNIALTMGLKF